VQESTGKRQRRASEFVFSRHPSENGIATGPPTGNVQHTKQQLPVSRSSPNIATQPSGGSLQNPFSSPDKEPSVPAVAINEQASHNNPTNTNATVIRRFHISRNAAAESTPGQALGVKTQQRPIIFSERRHVRLQTSDPSTNVNFQPDTASSTISEEAEPERPRKRPGQAARTPITPVTSGAASNNTQYMTLPRRNVRLPSGAMMPWDVNSEKLAAEMQAYTLQEIGRSIAQAEANKPKPRSIATPTKFKPKKPALRYHERHPEQALISTAGVSVDGSDIQDVEMDDDGDYVIDTYYRMPAHQVDSDTDDKFGLLVLDSQPDIDEFYKTQIEEEDEEEDFEEDENGNCCTIT